MSYPWGILGHNNEWKPRYGLWLDCSDECQRALEQLLWEGYDFNVVLKWSAAPREIIRASKYKTRKDAGEFGKVKSNGDYLREVFVADPVNLSRLMEVSL